MFSSSTRGTEVGGSLLIQGQAFVYRVSFRIAKAVQGAWLFLRTRVPAQHPHGDLSPSLTPLPEDLTHSSAPKPGTRVVHRHSGSQITHTQK